MSVPSIFGYDNINSIFERFGGKSISYTFKLITNIRQRLIYGATFGSLKIISSLPNRPLPDFYNIALLNATIYGHLDVVKYIITHGRYYRSLARLLLITSSQEWRLDIIKYLISKGANIGASEYLLLHYAVKHNDLEFYKYLLGKIKTLGYKLVTNESLVDAIEVGNDEMISFIENYKGFDQYIYPSRDSDLSDPRLKKYNLNLKRYESLLDNALERGILNLVKYFIGIGVDLKDEFPFGGAIFNRHLHIIKYLLSMGVEPTMENLPYNENKLLDYLALVYLNLNSGLNVMYIPYLKQSNKTIVSYF